MRVLALVCVLLLGNGCLVGENKGERESNTKINVGNDGENVSSPIPWRKCERLLTKHEDVTDDSHIIARDYRYKNTCVRLVVGFYEKEQSGRYRMEGDSAIGLPDKDMGSFKGASIFMERRGITCKENNNKLSLIFPDSNHGHADYKTIGLNCNDGSKLHVDIGLNKKGGDKLAITIEEKQESGGSVFHAFDTDDRGVIKKHVKVVGIGGTKEVMLNNFRKQ